MPAGPALSLGGFERGRKWRGRRTSRLEVVTVSLRRRGIWKKASGAADAKKSPFYEVEVSGRS